jgi:hypothetical protein
MVTGEPLAGEYVTFFPEHGILVAIDHEYLIAFSLDHGGEFGDQDIADNALSRLYKD